MIAKKDYKKLDVEELLAEEKRLKNREWTTRLIIGFLFGLMIYGVAKNGFGFIYIFFPLLLISGILINSKNQRQQLLSINQEIDLRNKN